jgi:Cu2+-exporting ATPase/Cu+-exporting ATPase
MGCRQVFLALTAATGVLPEDFRTTDLYRACVKAGIISASPGDGRTESVPSDGASSLPDLDLSFRLDNMSCPACAWLIEEVLRRKPGVVDPRVSFLSDKVRLRYRPHLTTPSEIASTVAKLGYPVLPAEGDEPGRTGRGDLFRLGVSAILSANAMMLSWTIYSGLFRDLGSTVLPYLSYPLLLITTPVIFYGGLPILRNAWTGLRLGRVSMDTLIAMSSLAAFAYSLIQMAKGSVHLYFDTAAMLITIVLLGRYIEARIRRRVVAGTGIEELGSTKARLKVEGLDRWVRADSLIPGDIFVVGAGERVPLDGRIVRGEALVDQSVITGEAQPVSKGLDDEVLAGSLLTDGELSVSTSRILEESSLSRMFDLVSKALETKSRGEDLADSVSRFFIPALIAATGCTALLLYLLGVPGEEVLFRSLTMLLISCPCAIGVALPLVKTAMVGLARKKGILIRNPEALQKIPDIDTIVLDKTGTITEGSFTVRHVAASGLEERDFLPLIAAIEASSIHPVAREIVRYAGRRGFASVKATEIEEIEAAGVTGLAGGKKVFVGNRSLVSRCVALLAPSLDDEADPWEREGMTTVFFGWDRKVVGFLVLGDPIKAGARAFTSWLRARKIRPLVLSGDSIKTTEAVARFISVEESIGEMLPFEKARKVKALQEEGKKVMVIGDGVNDIAALTAADVGMAFGAAFHSMGEAADLILNTSRLDAVEALFSIAALSSRTTRQSLVFAFVYNALAIPLAAAGLLNPLIAVFAMFASSLTVILNALRVSRKESDSEASIGNGAHGLRLPSHLPPPRIIRSVDPYTDAGKSDHQTLGQFLPEEDHP